MTVTPKQQSATLTVLTPGGMQGRRLTVAGEVAIVGRAPNCDIRLDDPSVSRRHAALFSRGNGLLVEDLGSTGGTRVNGHLVTGRTPLRPGDRVEFATIAARVDAAAADDATLQLPSDTPARIPPPPPPAASYDVERQEAWQISNVARDQYTTYVQQVAEQRDAFLRDVAATKTKARWLAWLGFVILLTGFGIFAAYDINFISRITNDLSSNNPTPPSDPFGRPIAGIPAALLGFAIAAVGGVIMMIGIVLHVTASARRRRIDRELPVPAPWQMSGWPPVPPQLPRRQP